MTTNKCNLIYYNLNNHKNHIDDYKTYMEINNIDNNGIMMVIGIAMKITTIVEMNII